MNDKESRIILDSLLGKVFFRKNNRARKYIIRIKADAISVTIPYRGNYKEAEVFFMKNRELIIQKREIVKTKNESLSPAALAPYDETTLRKQAQNILPVELERLAHEYDFRYQSVSVRKSKTRWGSCSSKGTINLSLFLMLLPRHLMEYVLLHELCHTVHMNHSLAFWTLLDQCTQGKAKELRKELRMYAQKVQG